MSKLTLTSNIFSKPSVLKYSKNAANASETVDLSSISINRENFDEFVHVSDHLPIKIKEKLNGIKDIVGNYARHENVDVNFMLTPLPADLRGRGRAREPFTPGQVDGFDVDIFVTNNKTTQSSAMTAHPIDTQAATFERTVFKKIQTMVDGFEDNIRYTNDLL